MNEKRRTSAPTGRLRATAYHEAGHAVVALCGGDLTPRRLTIVAAGGALGSCAHHPWGSRFRPDMEMTPRRMWLLQARIDTLIAGMTAERQGSGRRRNWVGAADDLQKAVDLASYLNGSGHQVELYLAWRRECVRAAVESRWAEIERLADALLEVGTIEDEDEIRRVVFDLNDAEVALRDRRRKRASSGTRLQDQPR